MPNLLMRVLDPIFGHPRGLAGRVGGVLMTRSNAEQERWVVAHPELRDGADVLLRGTALGLGIEAAAAATAPTVSCGRCGSLSHHA